MCNIKEVEKMYIEDFLRKIQEKTGKSSKWMGDGFSCCCPAHNDSRPSLSVSNASDGKILLKCYAGCGVEEICAALDLGVADLFPGPKEAPQRVWQDEYIFTNEDGVPLYKKVRVCPKKFFILSCDGKGHWERGFKSGKRVLYRLPEVIATREKGHLIFLVEGEKDADRLCAEGMTATTPIEGAGSNLRAEYAEQLKGADVVLLFDEDKAGYQRRDQWLKLLYGIALKVRVVKLPGIEYQEKGGDDVSDWLRKGHAVDELLKLVEKTAAFSFPESKKERLVALDLQEFLNKEIPERKMILSPIIPEQGLVMLYSKRGVGKTFLSLAIGYAVAAGIPLLRWQSMKSVPVLYVDGEMPASLMQERIAKLIEGAEVKLSDPSYFRLVTPDMQEEGIPDISTPEGQQLIESVIGDAKLVIFDNLSTLAPSVQENESDAWAPIQCWGLQLRKRGISVLFVHHAGKSGKQRGTSRREDILDTVVLLRYAEGYSPAEGAAFEVHIEKARGFFGDDAEPFLARLEVNDNGVLSWSETTFQEDFYDEVVKGTRSGKSLRILAKELEITKSKVEKIVKTAREHGDLPEVSIEN